MIVDQQPDIVLEKEDSDDELKKKAKFVKYDIEESKLDSSGLFYKDSDSELEMESDSDDEKEKETLGIRIIIIFTYSLKTCIYLLQVLYINKQYIIST